MQLPARRSDTQHLLLRDKHNGLFAEYLQRESCRACQLAGEMADKSFWKSYEYVCLGELRLPGDACHLRSPAVSVCDKRLAVFINKSLNASKTLPIKQIKTNRTTQN